MSGLPPEQLLEQVRADLDELERQRLDAGLCACPCGETLPVHRSSRTKYRNDRHRNRAHRERVKAEANALGVRERQSLQSLQRTASTGERRADAPAPRKRAQRRPRAGVSIYLPRPELVELVERAITAERDELELLYDGSELDADEVLERVRKAKARLERVRGRRDDAQRPSTPGGPRA